MGDNTVSLCKCNNCDGVFIDGLNFGFPVTQLAAMRYVNQLGIKWPVPELSLGKDRNGFFHGCPDFKTDAYLSDIEIIEQ